MQGKKQSAVRCRKREPPSRLTGVPGSPSASPAPPSASPAPKASDRKLSKSPYLSLGTVQETG